MNAIDKIILIVIISGLESVNFLNLAFIRLTISTANTIPNMKEKNIVFINSASAIADFASIGLFY